MYEQCSTGGLTLVTSSIVDVAEAYPGAVAPEPAATSMRLAEAWGSIVKGCAGLSADDLPVALPLLRSAAVGGD